MLQLNLVVSINAKDVYMYTYIHVYTFHNIPCYFIIFIDLTYDICHISLAYVFLDLVILFIFAAGMVVDNSILMMHLNKYY